MPCAFEKDAPKVFGDVTSSNFNFRADQPWILPEARLCDRAQLHASQVTFFGFKWNARQESVAAFGELLRAASLSLQTPVVDDVLLSRFKAGLPLSLPDQAILVTSDYDTVVSVFPELSSAQLIVSIERVLEVEEPRASSYGLHSK